MKLIVTRYVTRKRGFNQGPEFLVGHVFGDEAVAGEDALGVGVDDEDIFVAGIKKDGVGGFRANAVDGEELFAQCECGGAEHAGEGAGIFGAEEAHEGFQSFGLLAEIARGADQRSEASGGDAFEGERSQKAFTAKIGDGAFDVGPRGVLGEDGADDDFEGGTGRPPVLWAEVVEEGLVI